MSAVNDRIAIAAALGCAPAIATGVTPAILSDHYRTRIEQIAAVLTERQCLMFGCECARRAAKVWNAMFPGDSRPQAALEAAERWLQDNEYYADFNALTDAAEQSHIDVDYPELMEDVDPPLCAAMKAASACSHAALAVQAIRDCEGHKRICEITAWIARFAMRSASDQQSEKEWQTHRLVEMVACSPA